MNIFILSDKPTLYDHIIENSRFHCDKHVVKMIAESTQMLVTAMHSPSKTLRDQLGTYIPDTLHPFPCRVLSPSMRRHPCTVWASEDIRNFNYLASLALALCIEHQWRYPMSPRHAYMQWLDALDYFLATIGGGIHADNLMPSNFAIAVKIEALKGLRLPLADACKIYRDYYFTDKARFATWTDQEIPDWFHERRAIQVLVNGE